MNFELITITDQNVKTLIDLARDARQDGYRFVQRTIDEWLLRINAFSKDGEILNGILLGDKIIAIGGLNIDPYMDDPSIGRVRHMYVHRDYRENGLSKVLMKKIIKDAKKSFRLLRLSTNNEVAVALYENLGFEKVKVHKATHVLTLKK